MNNWDTEEQHDAELQAELKALEAEINKINKLIYLEYCKSIWRYLIKSPIKLLLIIVSLVGILFIVKSCTSSKSTIINPPMVTQVNYNQRYSIQYLIAHPDTAKQINRDCEKTSESLYIENYQLNCLVAYEAIKAISK